METKKKRSMLANLVIQCPKYKFLLKMMIELLLQAQITVLVMALFLNSFKSLIDY
jgi:hypothetical protein